jgi:hypothetical protein
MGTCIPCSSDLHGVLDCSTLAVVRTCPGNTACGPEGQCIAPCDAARANRSSTGCEYYAITPDAYSNTADSPLTAGTAAGGCYAAFIANTWTTPVSVAVDFNGQTLDLSKSAYISRGSGSALQYVPLAGAQIAPDQVAIVFLAQSAPGDGSDPTLTDYRTACPSGVTPAYTTADAAIHGTGRGHAFHITTSSPVVAFDIYPYGGAIAAVTSATLLLPTSVWDVNYVTASAYQGETYTIGTTVNYDSNIAFVASSDHTSIVVNPSVAIVGGAGVAAAAKGAPQTYILDAGESIQFEQLDDLSGSTVLADKPIGVWGGHWAMNIPSDAHAADAAHQEIPPVRALGSEYVAVRYRSRIAGEESVPWRMVGAVDGTVMSYEPSAPAGAPATLSQGQVAEFQTSSPFVVRSQDASHPFYLAGHMTGGDLANTLGDPETVNVVPPEQFLDHYVFFTDPTYDETNLVVVRAASKKNDVTLDCLSTPLTGWQPVGTKYEYTRVDVQHNAAPVGACDNGRHVMTSAAPFGVTVWGFAHAVSYAYPAGAGVRAINTVVVPPTPR